MLLLDYQELDIGENSTTLGWITEDRNGTCNTFILQGFTLSTIQSGDLTEQAFSITLVNGYTATIPSDEYMNSAGEAILYRLIAVDNNAAICSNMVTQETFYRLDGKRLILYNYKKNTFCRGRD